MAPQPSNCSCSGTAAPVTHGMIDANTYYCSRVTWPLDLSYVQENGELKSLKKIVDEKYQGENQGKNTVGMGNFLVNLNTEMYNKYKVTVGGQDNDKYKKNIPSLIIAATMDMEFAHLGGYDGKTISPDKNRPFRGWEIQIKDTETVATSNPLRLFPLLSYDPRRYRLSGPDYSKEDQGTWKNPFVRIVGHNYSDSSIKKIWAGFHMNPTLGFRPYDEFCEYLLKFYEECEEKGIPILANCVLGRIIAHNATSYKDFDMDKRNERKEKGKTLCSDQYRGRESVTDDDGLNHFYMNYGHPRNWIPVLKKFPGLRLCFAGFGGNSEWQHPSMTDWVSKIKNGQLPSDDKNNPPADEKNVQWPPREWIRCIIKLTRDNNVYVDISGLNIYNNFVWFALREMLILIQNEHKDFKHLKYKLIFGSGWHFTHLMDMSNGTALTSHSYNDYCREFKKLFDEVDPTGEFWERVSLINPWKFYRLDSKIEKMRETLTVNDGADKEMLGKMKSMFDKTDECNMKLVDYIACCMKDDPVVEPPKAPDEKDDDLKPVMESPVASDETGNKLTPISDNFALSLANFTQDNEKKYIRGKTDPKDKEKILEGKNVEKMKFDCSWWVGYCINTVYKKIYGTELKEDYRTFYDKVVLGDTSSMIAYARNRKDDNFRERSSSNDGKKLNPQVGELAFWRGHVEIVVAVDGEKFRMSGSSGEDGGMVPYQKPTIDGYFKDSWNDKLKSWGRGAANKDKNGEPDPQGEFLGFWTIEFSEMDK